VRRARTVAAWVLLIGATVGWPVSMLTVARDEPPFVLSLSWLAIVIEAASLLTASQVHEQQSNSD
jgi:ribose/xylose/arabinose/galactoside ABC-type transport system permease subunit